MQASRLNCIRWQALQPAPHARSIAAIDIAELALKIGFLAGDYTIPNDQGERYRYQQQPEGVEGNGQADEAQHHGEVNGIAREPVGAGVDYCRGDANV
jgi:hypothetical protein